MAVAVTAYSAALPTGAGLVTWLQAAPFQCSSSECVAPDDALPVEPTAQASLAETTVIALSWPTLLSTPGLVTRDQDFPFQCSISGSELEPTFVEPTAHALLAETAATARTCPAAL